MTLARLAPIIHALLRRTTAIVHSIFDSASTFRKSFIWETNGIQAYPRAHNLVYFDVTEIVDFAARNKIPPEKCVPTVMARKIVHFAVDITNPFAYKVCKPQWANV